MSAMSDCKAQVDAALRANFNTREALEKLRDLARALTAYRMGSTPSTAPLHVATMSNVADYLKSALGVFGLEFEIEGGIEIAPAMDVLQEFRRGVRAAAMAK